MLLRTPEVDTVSFERETGWTFKPEGACKGDVCIPLSAQPGATMDAVSIARDMGLPVATNAAHQLSAIGPESIGSRALTSASLPDIRLPDLNGNEFSIRSLLGQKIIVYAWAPY